MELNPTLDEATAVEVERGGAPEVAPPGGEDLGARAVFGGEEGDYLTEEVVGEVADAVHASSIFARSGSLHFHLHLHEA
jgi:hypothetical protein